MLPPKLNHEEIENLNRLVRRLNQQPKKVQQRSTLGYMNSVLNSTKHKILVKDNHLQMLPKNEEKGALSNSFHEDCSISFYQRETKTLQKRNLRYISS